jgi:hypothetical protein
MRPMRALLAALLLLLCAPAVALAHGDASTHYLESGNFYPGFGERASQATELKLMGLLDAAQKAGYPIKVSILGDESDVSDTPAMLKHPQRYAEFVARELIRSNELSAPVIIVSPYGIGVAGPGAEKIDVSTGTSGDQRDQAAMAAVRTLAEAGGHALPAYVPPVQVADDKPVPVKGPGYDLSGLTPFAVFIAIFGSAYLYLQVRTRMARRRPVRGV